MRRAAFLLSILLLGTLAFLAWMHPAVLWPTNLGWLLNGEDRGQSMLGLAAYLRAGEPWPGLREPLLAAPEGMTLLFTDSIPLLGLMLKPFASWLPVGGQYVGLWYLACCLLQAGFAAALVRRHAPDPLAAWCGAALLVLMPALFNRFGHASLCAQWLLLWALWTFVDPRRSRAGWWWAAVLGVAALIHSYLLLMVLAFWSGAMLEALVRADRLRRWAGGAAALVPAFAIMWAHGAFDGPYAATHTYGAFPAALDAWWNVANPDYAALVPSSPRAPDGRGFEGLQYLGAGLLALVVLLAGQVAARRLDPERGAILRRLLWLLPPFAALALLAIGPTPLWRGEPLFVADLPRWLVDALDPVRASGRLVWPATYTLAFAAVLAATGWTRATLVLGAALALQVVDLTPMLAATRNSSRLADDPRRFARTPDPRWTEWAAQASAVQFEPARPFVDLQVMEEIGWRAVVACRPLRYFYASREALATRARIDADSRAFQAGRLDPTRLYVLLGTDPIPATLTAGVAVVNGVRVIPPRRPAPPPTCSASAP